MPDRTTVTLSQDEHKDLMATAAQTAAKEGQTRLSVRQLINKMHALWKSQL